MKMPNAVAALGANVSLTVTSITDIQPAPTDARAALVMGNDGITYREQETTPIVRTPMNQPDDWIDPKVGMANYEVFVSNAGPDTVTGTLDTWLPLSAEQLWALLVTATADETAVLSVSVRQGSLVLAGPTEYTLRAASVV